MQIPNFHEDDGTAVDPEAKLISWARNNLPKEQFVAFFVAVARHWMDGGNVLNYSEVQKMLDEITSAE